MSFYVLQIPKTPVRQKILHDQIRIEQVIKHDIEFYEKPNSLGPHI